MSKSHHGALTLELTRGEVATLDRALRFYAAKYQDMAGREKHPADKQDLLNYVARADDLILRLRPELQHRSAGGSSALPEREGDSNES